MMQYIAAVSGGPDSMCMLNMYKKNIVAVCHVNYKKRQSADRDMQIVKHFCLKNKIRFFPLIINKNKLTKYLKINKNFQNAARLIRYDFFNQCASKIKNFNLIVAHTKSDFLETALMQKQRNSKTLFLGIHEHGKYKDLNIYRPILNMTKNETLAYCLKNKILYGIDETNELPIYERNIVRKEMEK
jgi:tRNA(Ile)-lysidine synthase